MNESDKLRQAYETLGLEANAPLEDVEKRYDIMLRKLHNLQKNEQSTQSDLSTVNQAYRLIREQYNKHTIESINQQHYGKYKRFAGQAQKFDHLKTYYKWHFIAGVAGIILIIYLISSYMDHRTEQARLDALPPIDLEATFIGRFDLPQGSDNIEALEQTVVDQIPEWNRVAFNIISINMQNPDYAMMQKAVVQIATEHPDLYFMDSDSFKWVAQSNGALVNLDTEASGRFKDLLSSDQIMKVATQDDASEHVYGINISESPYAKSLPILNKEIIVGIRGNAKHPDNALLLIERFLQAIPDK